MSPSAKPRLAPGASIAPGVPPPVSLTRVLPRTAWGPCSLNARPAQGEVGKAWWTRTRQLQRDPGRSLAETPGQPGDRPALSPPARWDWPGPGGPVPAGCAPPYLVITISMSIFSVGYSSQAARPRGQGDSRWWLGPTPCTATHGPLFPALRPVPSQTPPQPDYGPAQTRGSSPMLSGLNAATTSRRGQAFQYRVEMARLGGWYLKQVGDRLALATPRPVTKTRPG